MTSSTTPTTATTHPLAPLSAKEVKAATEILTGSHRIADGSRFVSVSLQEPPKEEVLAWDDATPLEPRGIRSRLRPRRPSAARGGRLPHP